MGSLCGPALHKGRAATRAWEGGGEGLDSKVPPRAGRWGRLQVSPEQAGTRAVSAVTRVANSLPLPRGTKNSSGELSSRIQASQEGNGKPAGPGPTAWPRPGAPPRTCTLLPRPSPSPLPDHAGRGHRGTASSGDRYRRLQLLSAPAKAQASLEGRVLPRRYGQLSVLCKPLRPPSSRGSLSHAQLLPAWLPTGARGQATHYTQCGGWWAGTPTRHEFRPKGQTCKVHAAAAHGVPGPTPVRRQATGCS